MAAPAPSRKPAQGERVPAAAVPAGVKAAGYTSMVNVYFDHLPKCVKGIPYPMLGIIYRQTIGGEGRPTSAKILMTEFADQLGCTEEGAAKAIEWLEKKNLIASEKAGKGRRYQALFENWPNAEPLPVRTVSAGEEEEEEAEDEEEGEATAVRGHETVKFTVTPGKKAKPIEFANGLKLIPEFKCHFPVEIEAGFWDDALHVISDLRSLHPYSSTDVAKIELVKNGSGDGKQKGKTEKDIRTPVRMFELTDALTPVFLHRYHKLPDEQFVSQIAGILGDCPVGGFMRTVSARLKNDARAGSGLFLGLAREAAGAWEKSKPAPQPEAPQRAVVFEDESSGSLWMEIRLELKQRLSPQDYANWMVGTAYRGFNLHEGKLSVTTADDVTADWCREEFALKISQIIRDLQLPVKEVVYKSAHGCTEIKAPV